jgi:glycosyltransferase involved in cell wall biosynthesis
MINMKILHVGETLKGGIGTYVNELVRLQQVASGPNKILILAPDRHLAQLTDVDQLSIRTFRRPNRISGLIFLTCALIKALVKERPDILHAHSTFAGVIGRLISFAFGIRVVYTPHGWAMDIATSKIKRRFYSLVEVVLSPLCEKIVAVSEYERLRGIDAGISAQKIATIHNGVRSTPPAVEPAPWQDERIKLLFVGRLDHQKGVDILLEAIKGMEDRVAVRIIGDSVVNRTAYDFANLSHVEALGWASADEVAAQMMSCDAVIVPSRWEGFGLVAVEALRVAKPVIAAAVGGLKEIVVEGRNGTLFPPGDSQALRKILSDHDKSYFKRISTYSRSIFLELFVADRMCSAVWKLYWECVRNRMDGL